MRCPFLVAVVTFNRFLVLLLIGMSIVPPPAITSGDSGKSAPVSVVVESAVEGDTSPSPAPSFPADSKPVIVIIFLYLSCVSRNMVLNGSVVGNFLRLSIKFSYSPSCCIFPCFLRLSSCSFSKSPFAFSIDSSIFFKSISKFSFCSSSCIVRLLCIFANNPLLILTTILLNIINLMTSLTIIEASCVWSLLCILDISSFFLSIKKLFGMEKLSGLTPPPAIAFKKDIIKSINSLLSSGLVLSGNASSIASAAATAVVS